MFSAVNSGRNPCTFGSLKTPLWIRWTLPRIRIDQVLYACVQVLLPLTMVILLGNTFWILGMHTLKLGWLEGLDRILHVMLVLIGYAFVIGMLAVAALQFRRPD